MVSGTLTSAGRVSKLLNGKLNGDQITFTVNGQTHTGRVSGERIDGTIKAGASSNAWSATRDAKS